MKDSKMRNIRQYPLTTEEVSKLLLDLELEISETKPKIIGNIQPLMLQTVAAFIKANKIQFEQFLKEKSNV